MDPINFILMANTMKFKDMNKVKSIFDLKGSLQGRISYPGETVLKDQNLLFDGHFRKNQKSEGLLEFKKEDIARIHKILHTDAVFLKQC